MTQRKQTACEDIHADVKTVWMVPVSDVTESHLSTHDEPNEEGDYRHAKNQQLSAVASSEGLRVQVHHSCHQTLHTHKLQHKPDIFTN